MSIEEGYLLLKHGMTAITSSVLTFLGISMRYQTRSDCKDAHARYDKLIDQRFKNQEYKQTAMHEDIKQVRNLVEKMASDIYTPRFKGDK